MPSPARRITAARNVALAFILLLTSGHPLISPASASSTGLTADAQYDYALSCLKAQDYPCAADEFRRFIHFFPADQRVAGARLQMGRAQLLADMPEAAVKSFETVIKRYEGRPEAVQAAFLKAEAWNRLNAPNQALLTLNNLISSTTDDAVKDRVRFRSAWIHIDHGNWPAARAALNAISADHRDQYRADTLLNDLAAVDSIVAKSPALAGSLSIVPGMGQLYCGRYEDALIAFLVNGGLIWASIEAFNNDLYALGSVIGFVELGFYAGNIYGAVSDAHKFNRRAVQTFKNDLSRRWRVGMLPAPQKDGIGLVLQFDY